MDLAGDVVAGPLEERHQSVTDAVVAARAPAADGAREAMDAQNVEGPAAACAPSRGPAVVPRAVGGVHIVTEVPAQAHGLAEAEAGRRGKVAVRECGGVLGGDGQEPSPGAGASAGAEPCAAAPVQGGEHRGARARGETEAEAPLALGEARAAISPGPRPRRLDPDHGARVGEEDTALRQRGGRAAEFARPGRVA